MARKHRKSKKRGKNSQAPQRMSASRPTLVLRGRFQISTVSNPNTQKRLDIAPTLQNFRDEILKQSLNFQTYRISKVSVKFLALNNVNTTTQPLLFVYDVPLTTATVPAPTQTAFLAFKSCRYMRFADDFSRSFVPLAYTGGVNSVLLRAPRIPVQNVSQVHYGHSFLFANIGTIVVRIIAVVDATIQFYTYDGG